MMRRYVVLAAALLVVAGLGTGRVQGGGPQKVDFVSTSAGKQEMVYGYLTLPQRVDKPVPAMVLIHGSSGLSERETRYAREFGEMGIATFAVDSFVPRGVRSTVEDQTRVSGSTMVSDAFGALKLLRDNPLIDKERIGIMGASKGGTVAIDTAMRQVAAARRLPDDLKFAAHIALYPGCTYQYRNPATRGAPILMLLGGQDKYVGSEMCLLYADAIKKAGGNVDAIVYPAAAHSFDGADWQSYFFKDALNYSKCLLYVEENGSVTYAKTGEVIDNPKKAFNVMWKECVTKGASGGTDPEAKKKSLEDIRDFLNRTLLKK